MNNTREVMELVNGINDCFSVIRNANELKAETGRIRNVVDATFLDSVIANCSVVVRELNKELEAEYRRRNE